MLVSESPTNPVFTGPSLRVFQLQQLLQDYFEVVITNCCPPLHELNIFDFIYVNAPFLSQFPALKKAKSGLIIDLYVPFFFEHLACYQQNPDSLTIKERLSLDKAVLVDALQQGHIFLTASERQADLYSGLLYLLRDVKSFWRPLSLNFFLPNLEALNIGEKNSLKTVFRIAWVGGFWEWLEPQPFLDIIPRLLEEHERLEFYFIGLEHPFYPSLTVTGNLQAVTKLTEQYPNRVQLIGWQAYQDYLQLLRGIDLAVVLHKNTIEAVYSVRTRFLELLSLGIPIFCSSGGYFAEQIAKYGLGSIIKDNSPVVLYREIQSYLTNSHNLAFNYAGFADLHRFTALQKSLLDTLNNFLVSSEEKEQALEKPALSNGMDSSNPYLKIKLFQPYYLYYRLRRKFRHIFRKWL